MTVGAVLGGEQLVDGRLTLFVCLRLARQILLEFVLLVAFFGHALVGQRSTHSQIGAVLLQFTQLVELTGKLLALGLQPLLVALQLRLDGVAVDINIAIGTVVFLLAERLGHLGKRLLSLVGEGNAGLASHAWRGPGGPRGAS